MSYTCRAGVRMGPGHRAPEPPGAPAWCVLSLVTYMCHLCHISLCSLVSLVTDEGRTECCDGVTRSGARPTHPPAQAADADCWYSPGEMSHFVRTADPQPGINHQNSGDLTLKERPWLTPSSKVHAAAPAACGLMTLNWCELRTAGQKMLLLVSRFRDRSQHSVEHHHNRDQTQQRHGGQPSVPPRQTGRGCPNNSSLCSCQNTLESQQ